jgi:hypothetical protein
VGAGAYGNTQVASYLLHFDGDIEFTSSTAKIGNVDVITVGDHIRSPAYQFSNGTSIFDGITGGGSTYSNANVVANLQNFVTSISTSANITTTANVIAPNYLFANGVNILSTVSGGGTTYTNANVVSMLAANTYIAFGNVVTTYPTLANVTTLFVGNNTTIATGSASAMSATHILNNAYFGANGAMYARNTYASGIGQFYIDGGNFYWNAQSTATANAVAGLGSRMSLTSTTLATLNGTVFNSAGLITAAGGISVTNSAGITTNQATIPLFNTAATTISFGNAATTIYMGASTGNVFVGNAIGTTVGNLTVRARGTYNTLTLASSQGGYNSPPYSNVALTGGSGTGITASWSSVGGYVNGAVTVINPGSGYRNGDTLTLPNGLGSTVILTNYNSSIANGTTIGQADYNFGIDGNLTLPGNITIANVGSIRFANGVNYASTVTGTYSNANVVANLANYVSNIVSTANVTASYFVGNGSALTGITANNTGNIYGTSSNVTLVAGAYSWKFDNTGNLTLPGNTFAVNYANTTPVNVVTRFESTWTVPTGNSTQSFTVSPSKTYYMWVDCNIPNGILAWNATATVTNTNVPVVGAQYAWVYTGGGTPIDFTSIPNQFTGTGNTIVRSNTAPSATTNRFDFGINNTSGGNVTVRYGWVAIS